MNQERMTLTAPEPAAAQHSVDEQEFHWRRWAICIAGVLGIIVGFYKEETWRGKRAWEHYKQRLEATGGTIDWASCVPASVPDEVNFFKAPNMRQWFVGRGGSTLSSRLTGGLESFLQQRDTNSVAEVTIVSPDAIIATNAAEAILQFKYSALTAPPAQGEPNRVPENPAEAIPLMVLDDVPFTEAVRILAKQANVKYAVDPKLDVFMHSSPPNVSLRWTNISAEAALVQMLKSYNLQFVPAYGSDTALIIPRRDNASSVYVAPAASSEINTLLQQAVAPATNHDANAEATAASMFTVFLKSPPQFKPAHIIVRTKTIPTTEEVSAFFPNQPKLPPNLAYNWGKPHVEEVTGKPGSFRVSYSPVPYTFAADFLAWSDQFEPEFDELREALKRPYAQLPGSYDDPVTMPIPSFVTVRVVAQKLAERAQCHLLMAQPELALRDVTLIHDLCRLLENRPTVKPMTLVAAMINVAVSGLYVSVIEDGLRMNAWQEPQLAAIEDQLRQIDLPPYIAAAFECERASSCHILEGITPKRLQGLTGGYGINTNVWERLKDQQYLLLTFGPRGWVYQNMLSAATRMDRSMSVLDLKNHLILPRESESLNADVTEHRGFRPFTMLADVMTPNSSRAWQVCAKNQTLVNEALVVCALERHHLATGKYPEKLSTLAPQFLDCVPPDLFGGAPLKYRRTADGQFVLYSAGWNEKDDGGTPGTKDAMGFDANQGDWVWPYKQKLIK